MGYQKLQRESKSRQPFAQMHDLPCRTSFEMPSSACLHSPGNFPGTSRSIHSSTGPASLWFLFEAKTLLDTSEVFRLVSCVALIDAVHWASSPMSHSSMRSSILASSTLKNLKTNVPFTKACPYESQHRSTHWCRRRWFLSLWLLSGPW